MTSWEPLRRLRGAHRLWPALSLATALTGCQSVPSPPPAWAPPVHSDSAEPSRLGTVTVKHAEVYVNERPVRGSVPLNHGDKVATNGTGRAHIELADHDVVDLEENTDPWFVREGACVVVRLLFGSAFASGRRLCVEDEQGNRVTLNSAVYVQVAGGRTSITVVAGRVHLRTARDETEILNEAERIAIVNGRLVTRIVVPSSQLHLLHQLFPPIRRPQLLPR